MTETQVRRYRRQEVAAFRKTGEAFGGLSNMAPGFPIQLLGQRVRTAEALYQACRFPHLPQVQRMILDEISPMTAKMRSKPYRGQSRPDWDNVRVPIMKWCLRMKLASNWTKFSSLLLETGTLPIVEDSRKDDFWGAKPVADDMLEGRNVLGRLLMELREKLNSDPNSLRYVRPVPVVDFLMLSEPIGTVHVGPAEYVRRPEEKHRDGNAQPVFL
jgi:ribA/ribD-fused uncharacterized protein